MSHIVNRSSDSPQSSGAQLPEESGVQSPHQAGSTSDTKATNPANLADSTETETETETANLADSTETEVVPPEQRQQPIPPPSEPMQYRAIGLVKGKYMPSAEQLTRGTLLATDGTLIDAVLLGRVMSLVKNHLNLDQAHLWVVYPRSRQEDGNLHVQIVGVWEPEKLNQATSTEIPAVEESQPEVDTPDVPADGLPVLKNGYFSIRGEVIYQSREEEQVIVKIRQSPRKETEKIKFFKLKLKGFLGERVIGHFWDLQIDLQASALVIQEANDIGLLPVKKRVGGGRKPFNKGRRPDSRKSTNSQRPVRKGERPAATAPTPVKRKDPLPKPVKRAEPGGGGGSGNSA
ncbi:MAG: hypothetical protein WA828_19630 [Coleofasciculaceae cyanobacterium]